MSIRSSTYARKAPLMFFRVSDLVDTPRSIGDGGLHYRFQCVVDRATAGAFFIRTLISLACESLLTAASKEGGGGKSLVVLHIPVDGLEVEFVRRCGTGRMEER